MITIDLFKERQIELSKKVTNYKNRHASPKAPVHERLFAEAMEKETKSKIETERFKQNKPKSYMNKVSNEILKSRCNKPGTYIDVPLRMI